MAKTKLELEPQKNPNDAVPPERTTIPVIQEGIDVQKRQVITGTVRLSKTVHEREEIVDVPLLTSTVQIERIPINRVVEGPPPVRQDGETTVISIVEEVLVVTKQLVLKEELRISRHVAETQEPQRVTLRNEEITVERIPTQDTNTSKRSKF